MELRNMYISASAGSGKTYQLVNRFLAILCLQRLENGVDVSRLIAITFTRKAAGEFRERILATLAEGALSDEAADRLWHQRILPTITNENDGLLPGQKLTLPDSPNVFFRELLADVMHQFPKLRLCTIDSLFQEMVRALGYEFGIVNFENLTEDKEEDARRKALRQTYRTANNNPDLQETILNSISDEKEFSNLDNCLLSMVEDYHRHALNSPIEAWGTRDGELSDESAINFGTSREELTPSLSEDEFLEKVQKVKETAETTTKQKNIRDYAKGLGSLTLKLECEKSKNWGEFFAKCEAHGLKIEEIEQTRRAFIWKKLLQRTHTLRELIDAYEDNYNRDIRSHGLFTFDDVPRLLTGLNDGSALTLAQERLDAKLEHWLLDEFQDTAHNQYRILQDILKTRNQGGDEGSVLMVGDAKQSIYQFRGGDPNLFRQARADIFGLRDSSESSEYSAEMHLNVSYRSAQAVLDMSNDLFSNINNTAENATDEAREAWKKLGYQNHESAEGVSDKTGQGCAQIWEADKTKVYQTIARLLAKARPVGSRHGTCAILVRTGKEGTDLADALNRLKNEIQFEGDIAICNDNYVGQDSPLGQALMQLFCWLDNPADKKNLGLLRLSPLWDDTMQENARWEELNEQLATGGVSTVLAAVLPRLGNILAENEFLHQRMKTWVDKAAAFDAEGGSLSDWIALMRHASVREEPQGNVIQIMTIHKAKGLEFDMVIVPIPKNSMAEYRPNRITLLSRNKDKNGIPHALLLAPPHDEGKLGGMAAQRMAKDWQTEQEFAGFCELYVAVTRAKRAVYVVYPEGPKTSKVSYRSMMQQLSGKDDVKDGVRPTLDGNPARCIYAKGVDAWWKDLQQGEEKTEEKIEEKEDTLNYRFATPERRTPSSLSEESDFTAPSGKTDRARTFRLSDMKGAEFGTAVHALFEKVGWLGEGSMPDLGDSPAATAVRRALSTPAIARHFRKPSANCRLYREQNMEAFADGSWISGQIDRLVVEYEGNRPTRAHIFDYKTDTKSDPSVLAAIYRSQMNAYRRLVELAFGLSPAAVSVTLLHVSAESEPTAIEMPRGGTDT